MFRNTIQKLIDRPSAQGVVADAPDRALKVPHTEVGARVRKHPLIQQQVLRSKQLPDASAELLLTLPGRLSPHASVDQKADRAQCRAAVCACTPREQRKLAALVKAGRTGGSVRAAFASLRDGDFSAAFAPAEDLKKGAELAKAQKINLEALSWA
jgi:hypothetical protein